KSWPYAAPVMCRRVVGVGVIAVDHATGCTRVRSREGRISSRSGHPRQCAQPVGSLLQGTLRQLRDRHGLQEAVRGAGIHPRGHAHSRILEPSGHLQVLLGEHIAFGDGEPHRREAFEVGRSEEHTSELQSLAYLVCRLLLEKKKKTEKERK